MKKLILEAIDGLQIQKAMIPFLKSLKQSTGGKLYFDFSYMPIIKRKDGIFQTVTIYINKAETAVRLDFKAGMLQPSAIDFYFVISEEPQWTIDVENIDILKITNYIAQVIKTKKPLQLVLSEMIICDLSRISLKEESGAQLIRAWFEIIRNDRSKGLPYLCNTRPAHLFREFEQYDPRNRGKTNGGAFSQNLAPYLAKYDLENNFMKSKLLNPMRATSEIEVPTRLDVAQQQNVDLALTNSGNSEEGFTTEECFAMMDQAYRKVLENKSNFVLISGDAGIGKSFSLHEDETNSLMMQYGYNTNVPDPMLKLATKVDGELVPISSVVQKWKCKVVGKDNLYQPVEQILTTAHDEEEGDDGSVSESIKRKGKRRSIKEDSLESDDIDVLIRGSAEAENTARDRTGLGYFRVDIPRGKVGFIMKGKLNNASNLYKILWEYNGKDKIVVFDDINSILEDGDCIEMLKAATTSRKVRKLSAPQRNMIGDGYPLGFGYTGKVIIITNKYLKQIDTALKSRASETGSLGNFDLTFDQIMGQIEKVIRPIVNNDALFQQAWDYVYEVKKRAGKGMKGETPFELNKFEMRVFNGIISNIKTGLPTWKSLCDASILAKFHPSNKAKT